MMAHAPLTAAAGLCLLVSAIGAAVAQEAEKIEADVSARRIAVESTFTGERVVVFGAVENSRQHSTGATLYDIAVVIRSPEQTVIARQKNRVAGIWLNTESETFDDVPGYYAVLSTRPLDEIAKPELLRQHGIGFASLGFPVDDPGEAAQMAQEPFRDAVIRIKQREGLYYADEHGVSFIGASLFRATVHLPANAPVGDYSVDIFLFRNGEFLGQHASEFYLHKIGFGRMVTVLAFDYPLLYGIIAVLVATAAGLAASAAFRRD